MSYPIIPLSQPLIGDEEIAAVARVLRSGMLAQGPEVAALEEEFARYVGVKHAIACSSGTAALHLALLAHGVGPGDEVITTPFSFVATVSSILMTGARPVFVDVDDDYTIGVVERSYGREKQPGASFTLPVHLFGLPSDLALAFTGEDSNLIIEDCAQGIGARTSAGHVGSTHTGAFSLYATKNICSGEGGMVTTNNDLIAGRVRSLRHHGYTSVPYTHDRLGYNYRMTDVAAAIARVQLKKVRGWRVIRECNADFYDERLDPSIVRPPQRIATEHGWHQYTIRVPSESRDKIASYCKDHGVGTGIFYPIPLHQQPYIRRLVGDISLPKAEMFAQQVLQLPIGPHVDQERAERVVAVVNAAVKECG